MLQSHLDFLVGYSQETLDYLTNAYKENSQIYLSGERMAATVERMAAKPFVTAQARANGMASGDEYLQVPRFGEFFIGRDRFVGRLRECCAVGQTGLRGCPERRDAFSITFSYSWERIPVACWKYPHAIGQV